MDPKEKATGRRDRGSNQARFDSQYWTANVSPSERYVLSLPGTQKYRISPLDNTYDNLTIAGDWTMCGLDAGCVEAAVISGRLAAHAISSSPALEDIVAYDHP
jgi:predicted NAD/FAD-dependent oxidoreductase